MSGSKITNLIFGSPEERAQNKSYSALKKNIKQLTNKYNEAVKAGYIVEAAQLVTQMNIAIELKQGKISKEQLDKISPIVKGHEIWLIDYINENGQKYLDLTKKNKNMLLQIMAEFIIEDAKDGIVKFNCGRLGEFIVNSYINAADATVDNDKSPDKKVSGIQVLETFANSEMVVGTERASILIEAARLMDNTNPEYAIKAYELVGKVYSNPKYYESSEQSHGNYSLVFVGTSLDNMYKDEAEGAITRLQTNSSKDQKNNM